METAIQRTIHNFTSHYTELLQVVQSKNNKRGSIVSSLWEDSQILPNRMEPSRQFDFTLVWEEVPRMFVLSFRILWKNNPLSSRQRSAND